MTCPPTCHALCKHGLFFFFFLMMLLLLLSSSSLFPFTQCWSLEKAVTHRDQFKPIISRFNKLIDREDFQTGLLQVGLLAEAPSDDPEGGMGASSMDYSSSSSNSTSFGKQVTIQIQIHAFNSSITKPWIPHWPTTLLQVYGNERVEMMSLFAKSYNTIIEN